MAWLRCPHCAMLLENTTVAADECCGCPACGRVFAAPAVEEVLPEADDLDAFYPPDPPDVPDDLTAPSPRYQQGALLLLATLMLFFALYLGLLIGSGCLIFWSLRFRGLLGLPPAFICLIVFLYLLKGFFKSEMQGKTLQVEISEADQPRLFAFIRRLCREVGAPPPPPHRVFLSPDVNAAACYEHSLLGLLRPSPKNLILGLGLINVLTLSEFKAVLAHEFGHFAQRSMKLSAYVYAINRVLREVVIGRDWLDTAILRLRAQPNILSLAGHVCWGVVNGLRQVMTGLFYAINFLDKSLSRQMEFHADLMAVSVSGSEAIVRALARMDFANEALEAAAVDLKVAADHNRYSRDLPGDVKERIALDCFEKPSPEVLRQRHAALYGSKTAGRAAAYRKHLEERQKLLAYRREHGEDSKKPLEFRGGRYWAEDVENLLEFLDKQLDKDQKPLAEEDRAVFAVHYQMSRYLGTAAEQALRQRYVFHMALQRLLSMLITNGPRVFLADLPQFGVQSGLWPFRKDGRNGDGRPIQVNGKRSPKGLSMHPPTAPAFATVRYRLGKQAALFRAVVAINDTSKWCWSPATFTVLGDGKPLWQSAWIAHNHAHTQEGNVDVSAVDVLELRVQVVNGNQGVHAVWVEPRLLQKADTPDQ